MLRSSLFLATALLLPISSASAEFVYEFGHTNYNVIAGGTVDVDIFLSQNAPISADPVDLSLDGLTSAGVRIFFTDTPPTDPAVVLSIADVFPDDALDNSIISANIDLVSGESVGFVDSIDFFSLPITGSRIRLGAFRFTAGSVIGEVTSLRAERFDLSDNIIAGDIAGTSVGNLIDPGFATITVTAVPEPSSLALFAVAGTGLFLRRRRNPKVPKSERS